ncbi:protein DEPP [Latimeria chalumnae]|uniref:protein DEPP n=1 Tax=Latimeria chalumnae TaxID=7897 RepID=UPI0006D92C67|nr:PREDICTED: protein DEPP [Latimeria chalumnae]|eukprot:XP_014352086.1 PREDICTED: protein DEPP [Latimeria chalumnae]
MRSRLLLSVEQLPTICEMLSETCQDAACVQSEDTSTYPHHSLDEYIKSIGQLAQPSSLSDAEPCSPRSLHCGPARPYRPQRSKPSGSRLRANGFQLNDKENRAAPTRDSLVLEDITINADNHQNQREATGSTNPLDWLFGQPQRDFLARESCSPLAGRSSGTNVSGQQAAANTVAAPAMQRRKQTEPGKCRVRCSFKVASSREQKPLPESAEATEERSKPLRPQRRAAASSVTSRGRYTRLQKCGLPIIYEV